MNGDIEHVLGCAGELVRTARKWAQMSSRVMGPAEMAAIEQSLYNIATVIVTVPTAETYENAAQFLTHAQHMIHHEHGHYAENGREVPDTTAELAKALTPGVTLPVPPDLAEFVKENNIRVCKTQDVSGVSLRWGDDDVQHKLFPNEGEAWEMVRNYARRVTNL